MACHAGSWDEAADIRFIRIPISVDALIQETLASEAKAELQATGADSESVLDDLCPSYMPLPLSLVTEQSSPIHPTPSGAFESPVGPLPSLGNSVPLDSEQAGAPCIHAAPPQEPSASYTQSHANQRRARRRKRDKETNGQLPSAKVQSLFVKNASVVTTSLAGLDLPVTSGGYTAKIEKVAGAKKIYTKEELINKRGFQNIEWEGVKPIVFLDSNNRVFLVCVGRPDTDSYVDACNEVYEHMMEEAKNAGFTGKTACHRRGHFPAINVGVTHGKGTPRPMNLNNREHTSMMGRLISNQAVQQMAAFASASFAAFDPQLYQHYKATSDALFNCTSPHLSGLERLFPAHISVYPTAAFNFGPNVWTYKHKDPFNYAAGKCSVQPLGKFDPKKGGHLVIWEAKLVIEFPPASLILLPSAILTHSNLPVAKGDTRASFTQYAAGGLFRYVDYGFRTEKELQNEDPLLYQQLIKNRSSKWEQAYNLLSVVSEERIKNAILTL